MVDRGETRLPLSGVRVLELGYGIAAPVAARNLAQLGADVIRVESARKPDSLRMGGAGWLPPEFDHTVRRDTIPALNFSCPEKRSIGLEIDGAGGRAAFEQLVAATDVFVTNISEDALGALRIAYDDIRALRPDVVYLTLPAFGSEGPYRAYRTWGHNLSAAAGIDHLIGWPDRDPVQIGFAYPDFVSAQTATAAVLAALMRRDATGEGARLEVWQYAMALACLGPTVVAAQLSGEAPGATGNQAEGRAPHALYPALGNDRWVAVSVETDAMWESLCRVQGLESLATDARFATLELRLEHQDPLDDVVAAWTAERTDWEAATELQSVGIAASPVLDAWDVIADPQLAAREFFHALPHARFARDLVFGQAVRLSETPLRAERAAPAFGQHTREVLSELTDLDDAAIDRLIADGTALVMEREGTVFERPYLHWIRKVQRLVPWGEPTFDPATQMMRALEESEAPEA
jgi:benzylsuccinate CoA-transferase BbsF subunit